MTCADIEFLEVVCQHRIEPFARVGSFNDQLAHVRDVENADIISHGLMFVDDPAVLHRHEPTGERNHSRA